MSILSRPEFHNEEAAYAYVEARVWLQHQSSLELIIVSVQAGRLKALQPAIYENCSAAKLRVTNCKTSCLATTEPDLARLARTETERRSEPETGLARSLRGSHGGGKAL